MIGIYKITNNINKHCYIGQSINIYKRWENEKIASTNTNDKTYDYPLNRAFRKYGIQNFTFEIIEECSQEKLNERENYWINYLKPEYNQTAGGDYQAHGKLTFKEVEEIQNILINDIEGKVSHRKLAKKYNVSPDTIQAINAGRAWLNSNLQYPLHISIYDDRRIKPKYYCVDCKIEITKGSIRCVACANKKKQVPLDKMPVTREELKKLIRTIPFTTIGYQYGVSDNAIRKWCDKFNLPRKATEIKKYTDAEWELI